MNKLGLAFFVPKEKEKFDKLWNAMGRSFWLSFSGHDVNDPTDRTKDDMEYKLTAYIADIGKDLE